MDGQAKDRKTAGADAVTGHKLVEYVRGLRHRETRELMRDLGEMAGRARAGKNERVANLLIGMGQATKCMLMGAEPHALGPDEPSPAVGRVFPMMSEQDLAWFLPQLDDLLGRPAQGAAASGRLAVAAG